ncbi:dihydrofolate reductase family protein [Nibribacter koreensis]|uniref:Dihydrofolate reductase family protein n=1 Tax=Nibribacter koreensis TaxID=1084519 RepID=A0ABP8F8F7_9BACT
MERKVKLYIAASLDGFIAGPNDEIDWLNAYMDGSSDYGYNAFYAGVDTTLMGNGTYKVIQNFDPFPYIGKTNYVFSRQTTIPPAPHVDYISQDPVQFVTQLKTTPGKDIWLIGGGQINAILLNAGLIDEIILSYVPEILGRGIPLFTDQTHPTKFTLVSTESFKSGLVQLVLAKRG